MNNETRKASFAGRSFCIGLAVVILCAPFAGAQESPHGKLAVPCEQCHSPESWSTLANPLKFSHASTGFSLDGQHALVRCTGCHSTLKFAGAKTRCADCHDDVHRGELGKLCDRCHTPRSWLVPDMTQRHKGTRFALVGAHINAECRACHRNQQKNQYSGVQTECYACHAADYNGAKNPDHRAGGISTDCSQCHSVAALRWGGDFNHASTGFPLTGAHLSLPCSRCHSGNNFHAAPNACYTCHVQVFTSAANPKHTGFPTLCTTCHTTSAWRPASFDHNTAAFKLTGAHISVPCAQCHLNGKYTGTSSDCYTCHVQVFTSAANPKHSGFSTLCTTCHTTSAWRPASFDHNTAAFKLTGAHISVPCAQCHLNGKYTGTSSDCYTCHVQVFTSAANPKHSGFSTLCTTCHTTSAWRPASFDHNTAAFKLTGAHISVPCAQCHLNGKYTGTSSDCYTCHVQVFTSAANPKHTGFPTLCTTCHTTSAWRPASFDHNTAAFKLTGAHISVPCAQCHLNGKYTGTSSDCYTCHVQVFTSAANPKHSGFSTLCTTCHTTSAWRPASFDHNTAAFKLTGAHISVPCAQCHLNGVYTGTPSTCGNAACHLSRYNATTNPPHPGAGFSTDCQPCHSTTAWVPATFNHTTWFPISAGSRHSPGRWTVCADCHTVPTNYKQFSCIDCHQHSNKAQVDAAHQGKANYTYTSSGCYSCHPRGSN